MTGSSTKQARAPGVRSGTQLSSQGGTTMTGETISPTTIINAPAEAIFAVLDPTRDIMHPMFKELFIQTDEDDLLAEEDRRRRVRRFRRARPALVVRPAAGNRQQRSRP